MNKKYRSVDGELVKQYQSGIDEALPILVKRWHKQFCNKAYWLIKDPDVAKDIAQECWKTIIDKINNLNDPNSFGSWAMRIVYTKSLDWIRESNVKRLKLNAYQYEQSKVESEVVDDVCSLKVKLLEAVKLLPESQKTVIHLFYVESYSMKEISELLNISVGTAKSRLFYARETLKRKLKEI